MIVARGGGSLADLFAFCDETLCRTVALLRVPVIASVGHHTDRTLIDDVAAVCCSTPTHAAEAAVPVDVGAARRALAGQAARLRDHGRRAVISRARTLAALSRAPASHLARQRTRLHQLLRELRAAGRRTTATAAAGTRTHATALERAARRGAGAEAAGRRRELERLTLALSAHDPERTLARGYALVSDRAGGAAAERRGERSGRRAQPPLPRRRGERDRRDHDRGPAMTTTVRAPPTPTYETAVARVEEIVRRLDSGEAGLRETLELVREGRGLVEYCAGELEEVSRGLEELSLDDLVAAPGGAGRRHGGEHLRRALGARARPSTGGAWRGCGPTSRADSSGCRPSCTCVARDSRGSARTSSTPPTISGRSRRRARPDGLPDLSGRWALGEFCDHVDALDLFFGAEPEHGEVSRLYRRWTMHSAALDLALRQAQRPLHAALGREPAPLTFVVSLRLGEPATAAPVQARLESYPTLRFKLDATSSWTDELIEVLAATGAVDSVDFKAHYHGTVVDTTPDGALYRRVVAGFPDAWLEDPDVESEETAAALADVARPDHLGRSDPRDRRHRGAAVPAAHGQPQALPARRACGTCAPPTTTARRTGSVPTAAASSSSGPAADRPSTSPRCSIPTRPTTSPPCSTTRPRSSRACPPPRWRPPPARPAFAGAPRERPADGSEPPDAGRDFSQSVARHRQALVD